MFNYLNGWKQLRSLLSHSGHSLSNHSAFFLILIRASHFAALFLNDPQRVQRVVAVKQRRTVNRIASDVHVVQGLSPLASNNPHILRERCAATNLLEALKR